MVEATQLPTRAASVELPAYQVFIVDNIARPQNGPPPDVSALLTASDYVDLHPLVDVLSPPNRSAGRRLTHALAKVKLWLISRHPASGLPTRDAPLADLLADSDNGLAKAFGFGSGKTPHRSRIREAINRLEQHPDLVADATKSLEQVLRDKPWQPSDGVIFETRERGPSRGSNAYRRQRQATRFDLKRFREQFNTPEKIQDWFVQQRWPDGIRCPRCEGDDITERKNARPQPWRCRNCRYDFSVKTGTVMHSSNFPLRDWLAALWILLKQPKGQSSLTLADDLDCQHGSALHLTHRIREAMVSDKPVMQGPLQTDEVYLGGRERNKHSDRKLHAGRGAVGKVPVLGSYDERKGQIWLEVVSNVDGPTVRAYFRNFVLPGTVVYTDQAAVYAEVPGIVRESVNHSAGQYWWQGVTTNAIESVWALLRRIMMGTHHQVSRKHLPRYIQELVWRHNHRKMPVIERMATVVKGMVGKRLTRQQMRQGGRAGLSSIPPTEHEPPAAVQLELFEFRE